MESACLGVSFLGNCSYDPSSPTFTYFSLGELVSAITLLLAFIQLARTKTKFRLAAKNLPNKYTYSIIISSIISVFIATLLPIIPGAPLPLLGYPIFWEVATAVMVITLSAYMLKNSLEKSVFGKSNSASYLQACEEIIAKGKKEELQELAEEITTSVKQVFNLAANEIKEQPTKNNTISKSYNANTLLDLWSDKQFCSAIVTRSPSATREIFSSAQLHHQYLVGYNLLHQLTYLLFFNQDSFLNREPDKEILSNRRRLSELIFENIDFLESDYNLLSPIRISSESLLPSQLAKLFDCVQISYKAYFKRQQYDQNCYFLKTITEELGELAFSPIYQSEKLSEQDFYHSREFEFLGIIQSGFANLVDLINKQEGLPTSEFNEVTYDRHKDNSPYGWIAYGIYKYFCHLLWYTGRDEANRMLAIDIWCHVYGTDSSEISKAQGEVGKRLIFHLKQNINSNFDTHCPGYPAITRLLISLLGICEEPVKNGHLGSEFKHYFLQRLKTEFLTLYKTHPEVAEKLLPHRVECHPQNKLLFLKKKWPGEKDIELILSD